MSTHSPYIEHIWNLSSLFYQMSYHVIVRLVLDTVIYEQNCWRKKQLKQGYGVPRLKASLQKFCDRHLEVIDCYEITISQMAMDIFPFT